MADQKKSDAAPEQIVPSGSLNRRSFLSRVAMLGVAGLGGGSLLAACGGESSESGGSAGSAAGDESATGATTAEVQASECAGYDEYSEQVLQQRQNLNYVDQSPEANKLCSNCQFYKPNYELASGDPAPEDSPCVGCLLFKGPVAPGGYCTSWVAKA